MQVLDRFIAGYVAAWLMWFLEPAGTPSWVRVAVFVVVAFSWRRF